MFKFILKAKSYLFGSLRRLNMSVTNLYRLYHVEKKKVSLEVAEKSFKKSKLKDFYCLNYSHVANIRVIFVSYV